MALSLFLFVLIASTIMLNCINAAEDYQIEALKAHNEYRSWHEADDLIMDDDLNKRAGECLEALFFASVSEEFSITNHTCRCKSRLGQNHFYFGYIDKATRNGLPDSKKTAQQATQRWYDEIKDYNFNSPGFSYKTKHFTQLVWKATKRLGFAAASGFAAALYEPGGNYNYNNGYAKNVAAKTQKQASGHKNVLTASSAASRWQINLNTCNTVVIYSVAICYALLNLSQ